jgi:hypothetical protein
MPAEKAVDVKPAMSFYIMCYNNNNNNNNNNV